MARYLWPLLTMFLILSIGAPCVTFYILIKDYWAELSDLRQQLLFCQFSSTEAPFQDVLIEFPSLRKKVLDDSSKISLSGREKDSHPTTLPLISTSSSFGPNLLRPIQSDTPSKFEGNEVRPQSDSFTKESNHDSLPLYSSVAYSSPSPHRSDNIPSSPFSFSRRRLPSQLYFQQDAHRNPLKDTHLLKGLRRVTRTTPSMPTYPPPSVTLDGLMISDENQKTNPTTRGCYETDYAVSLERRVLDLTARVESCRKCLAGPKRRDGRCGGSGWKEFRRKEKALRKKIREEKRKRRKEKSKEENINSNFSSMNLERSNESDIEANADSAPNEPLGDVGYIPGWRTGENPSMSAHMMRENHRVSTDFRRGFNQKISRMDEALMQFSETQAAFCKELRDNLGGRLGKRGLELEALSDQITALVRTTTMQVSMLEKLMTDQVFSGQQSIEKNLAKTQALQDHQIRNIKAFQKRTFVPAMISLATLLGEQASGITNMGVELITKIEMLQDLHLTFSTQQSDTLLKMTESVEMFSSKHGNLLMRSNDHARHIHMNTENFIRELQARMNNVVKELVLIRLQSQSFVALSNDTYVDISSSLNKSRNAVNNLSLDLNGKINSAKEAQSEFKQIFTQETDLINERVQSGISQVLILNHDAVNKIGETELETRVFSDQAEFAWKELYLNQETELRLDADMLANNLRSHNHHTQNILAGLQGTAETHEQVLEEQRADFQSFVRKRQDALDTQCASISDWALLMSSELRRRDEDIHRFLNEEIRYSPVSTPRSDYSDYLISRLPDGSLIYHSSNESTHSNGRPPQDATYQSEEDSVDSVISYKHLFSPFLNGTFLPVTNSSRNPAHFSFFSPLKNTPLPESSHLIPLTRKQESVLKNSREKLLNPSIAKNSDNDTYKQHNDGEVISDHQPKEKVRNSNSPRGDHTRNSPIDQTRRNGDKLSNNIEVIQEEEDSENAIIHLNDENYSINSTDADCQKNKTKSEKEIRKEVEDFLIKYKDEDEEFKKLKDIVLMAKQSILKLHKDFKTGENSYLIRNKAKQDLEQNAETSASFDRPHKLPNSKRKAIATKDANLNKIRHRIKKTLKIKRKQRILKFPIN